MRVIWRRLGSQHVRWNFIFSAKASRSTVLLPCVEYKELEKIGRGGGAVKQ